MAVRSVRSFCGIIVKDLPRYVPALWGTGERYLSMRNRNEVLREAPDRSGFSCEWQWTSDLHAPKVIPAIGRRLLALALRNHPVRLCESNVGSDGQPDVTFIIGHRGKGRLPHLLKTLQSIAGQQAVAVECIVVEQDIKARLSGRLPGWVRHLYTRPPTPDMPFCRSWAFNVGARHARGHVLVLHDNDLLLSTDYTALCLSRIRAGFEVVDLKRFGFYLSEAHTHDIFENRVAINDQPPETIRQNLLGGGSIAITRDAYLRIGGMDEGYVGWGGEDNEFWDRAQTLRVWPYGCLPYIHLWHRDQPGKYRRDNPTAARHQNLSAIDVATRIERLLSTSSGDASGPACGTGPMVAPLSRREVATEFGVIGKCAV